MDRETIDSWLERGILALVIAAIVFATAAFGGVRASEFIVVWWLIIAAAVLWLARIWLAPKFRFLWPPLCWAILPFVAFAIFRYFTADIEYAARQELIQILLAALLLLIIVNNLYTQEATRLLSLVLVFYAMAVSMYGIYQVLSSTNTVWGMARPPEYLNRASGTYVCPNHLAGLIEMTFPLALALALAGRVSVLMRIALGYATLVLLAGLAMSQSRAGWIAGAVALLVLGAITVKWRSHRWIALGVVALVIGAGAWLYPRTVKERVSNLQLEGHNREIRLRLWSSAIQMWQQNPWVGVGPAHFDHRYRKFRDAADKTQSRPGYVHNDYLNTLADYGIIGLLLALLPLGVAAWMAVRCWPHVKRTGNDLVQKKSNRLAIVLGASVGLIALAVHSFFDFNMHIPANALVAATLLGLLATHMRFATERYWYTARWPLAVAASMILCAALAYLVPQGLRLSREVAWLKKANRAENGSNEQIALLKQAAAVEPKNFETTFAIGEYLRAAAFTGGENADALAREALEWFRRTMAVNQWHSPAYLRAGMCLSWMERYQEADAYFAKGLELDPNHWQARTMMGWHLFQQERYAEAVEWLEKAMQVGYGQRDRTPFLYYDLARKRLNEQKLREQIRSP